MTSSAIASTPGGMVRASALAVLRLITSSNWVGCKTGRSAALSPCLAGNYTARIHQYREYVAAGGLISYGASLTGVSTAYFCTVALVPSPQR